ncbi:MAG: PDZ domain-containing protein [Bacteroidales bacterium]|nr:PDZ domain-containing protein [Bacteroidales bacterium]MCL2132890.1 PDZ domain-containing protein [Bacteroidales bacterium]
MIQKNILLIILLVILFSCNRERKAIVLPEGAISVNGWVLPLKIYDSIPGNFLFDTGCYAMYIDSLYLSTIPLDTTGKTGAHTLHGSGEGKQETMYIRGPIACYLDTLSSVLPYAIITQLKPISGKSLDGVVGWDYLKDYMIEFNAANNYIRIISPDSLQNLQGYQKLSLIHEGYFYYITAKVAVTDSIEIDGEFLFDTGYSGSIRFTTAVAEQNHFSANLSNTITSYSSHAGFGGKSKWVSFRAKPLTIGDFEINSPILSFSKDTAGILSVGNYKGFYRNHNGLLGTEILKHFEIIIDFPHKHLYVRPSKNFNKEEQVDRSGFAFADRTDICDGLIVRSLQEQQNAEKVGIRLGDTITHINEKAVKELVIEDVHEILKKKKSVGLTIRRGNESLQIKLPLIDKPI